MKNVVKFILTFAVILFTGCYDRSVIDSKEFGFSLPAVENLKYAKQGDVVTLTWQIPANIPDYFKRPVDASIQIVEDDIYRNIIIVSNEDTSTDITIDTSKKYRFVVKLLGYLTDEAIEDGKTDRVYSEAKVIEIQ